MFIDQNLKNSWQNLAQNGFVFKSDISAFIDKPEVFSTMENQKKLNAQKAKELLQSPWIRTMLEKLFIGSIVKNIDGYELMAISHKKSNTKRHITKLVIPLQKIDENFPFEIKEKYFLRRVYEWFFSDQDPMANQELKEILYYLPLHKNQSKFLSDQQQTDRWKVAIHQEALMNLLLEIYQDALSIDRQYYQFDELSFKINTYSLSLSIDRPVPSLNELLAWEALCVQKIIPFLNKITEIH